MPDNEIDLRAINELEKALDLKFGSGNSNSTKTFVGEYLGVDEEGQAWVKFSGNEFATPLTAQGVTADIGDMINVSVSNGYAIGDGNFTSPLATSSHVEQVVEPVERAVENNRRDLLSTIKIAEEADAVAKATDQHFWDDTNGAHVTDLKKDDWLAGEADDFPDLSDSKPYHNLLMNSLGILLRRAHDNLVSITRSAITFFDGLGNAASNIVASFGVNGVTIGKSGAAHALVDADSFDLKYGNTEMIHFGYGSVQTESGTANAPYVSLGNRASGTIGKLSVVEGDGNLASGAYSHAEGRNTTASGVYSHVEGYRTTSSNFGTHSEGYADPYTGGSIIASGTGAHAEGRAARDAITASGNGSHAEGYAEVYPITASGNGSHAEGEGTTASGHRAHSQNYLTIAASQDQTAIGRLNVSDSSNTYALIIGNGVFVNGEAVRSNALTVDWDGNVKAGNILILGTNTEAEENGIRLKGGGTRNSWVLRTISAANGDGDAIILGDGGMTIVGGGESASSLWTELGLTAGTERLYLASDSSVYVTPNCQTVANRYTWEFNTAGNLQGPSDGSYVANNGQFYADSDDLTSGTHPSSETAGKGVVFRDSSNSVIGVIQPRFGTSTQAWQALRFYSQRSVGGTAKYNILDMRIDDNGNQAIYTNNAAAWRSGLGLGTAATHAHEDYIASTDSRVNSITSTNQEVYVQSLNSLARLVLTYNSTTGVHNLRVDTRASTSDAWASAYYPGIWPVDETTIANVVAQTSAQSSANPITAAKYYSVNGMAMLEVSFKPAAARAAGTAFDLGTVVSGKRPHLFASGGSQTNMARMTTAGAIQVVPRGALTAGTTYTIGFTYLT